MNNSKQNVNNNRTPEWQKFILQALRRANYYGSRRLRPGLRTLVGLLFVLGGIFGFLPILGFWMIPVGLLLIALDFPKLRRPTRAWLLRLKQKMHQ